MAPRALLALVSAAVLLASATAQSIWNAGVYANPGEYNCKAPTAADASLCPLGSYCTTLSVTNPPWGTATWTGCIAGTVFTTANAAATSCTGITTLINGVAAGSTSMLAAMGFSVKATGGLYNCLPGPVACTAAMTCSINAISIYALVPTITGISSTNTNNYNAAAVVGVAGSYTAATRNTATCISGSYKSSGIQNSAALCYADTPSPTGSCLSTTLTAGVAAAATAGYTNYGVSCTYNSAVAVAGAGAALLAAVAVAAMAL